MDKRSHCIAELANVADTDISDSVINSLSVLKR